MMKQLRVRIYSLCAVTCLMFGCTGLPSRTVTAYGKHFTATYRNNTPYSGQVLYQAAGDYYWVTTYSRGQFVKQDHIMIARDTNEHRLWAIKLVEDGPVQPVEQPNTPLETTGVPAAPQR